MIGCSVGGLAVAAGVLLGSFVSIRPAHAGPEDSPPDRRSRERIVEGYTELWSELDATLEEAAASIAEAPSNQRQVLAAFAELERVAAARRDSGLTLLLFDSNRRAVAWAGKGLLHDVDVARLPDRGRHHLASFSAVTLLVVDALFDSAAPWHLVAGRSLRVDEPPFSAGFDETSLESVRWTVVSRAAPVDAQHLRVDLPGSPTLVVDFSSGVGVDSRGQGKGLRPWLVVAGCLLVLLFGARPWGWLVGLAGLIAIGLGLAAPWWSLWVVSIGVVGAGVGSTRGPRPATPVIGMAWGGVVSALVLALSLGFEGPVQMDLGGELIGSPSVWFVRVASCAFVFGLLSLVGARNRAESATRDLLGLGALICALIAAATFDHATASAALVVLAGAMVGAWCTRTNHPRSPGQIGYLVLVAALIAGTAWELGHHRARSGQMADSTLAAMAPPTDDEFDQAIDQAEEYLTRLDLSDFSPARITDLERKDLAFEIWHDSPLAMNGALSALVVELPDGATSSFSFGLLLTDDEFVDLSPLRWQLARLPVWKDAVFHGVTDLMLAGRPWARARFWLALAPGFRLAVGREDDLTAELLRVGPGRTDPRLPDLNGIRYALYDRSGEPLHSPWRQSPRLDEPLLAGATGRVRVAEGQFEVATAVGPDGVRALFLPCPSWIEAWERVGVQALTSIVAALILALVLQLPTLRGRGLVRLWNRVWRSYSSRLVLVYSLLVLLPMLLTTLLVVRGQEERIRRDQRQAGETALESAQRILAEYLWELEPGFGIDSTLDNELLTWLASVVHHDVNLYWRSRVSSSSKSELFKAGLLPERIPGEIYSRLTLLGHDIASRTNRAGMAEYLEVYAPLTVPGVSRQRSRLFLSLPMLAQQEETAAEIASLRSRAALGTVSVMMILLAIGTRLARRFTTPLTEIVRGTQRIAAGEESLGLRPRELELETLVQAIDQMAERIALGRQRLLREKRVVERMVDNIAAGVVSLDAEGGVVMANRVAIEMLGVEVGDAIEAVLAADESLAPVLEFLQHRPGEGPIADAVQVEDAEGEQRDWSLVWVPLPGEGEPSALFVVEEVTEVLRAQRLGAWAEMARMIAHEIKNPLTPIRLSAEHMREVYTENPEKFAAVFESCTTNILRQVDELHEIASDFSTYSRIPKIELRRGRLNEILASICGAYESTGPRGVEVVFRPDPTDVVTEFDAKLLGRAVRNLIENAMRATGRGGRIEVTAQSEVDRARIVVTDSGTGVEAAILHRIFDPYFSTHDSGTGLGLPIARRIVEEHGGTISAHNRVGGGLEVVISLPRHGDG